MKKLLAFAIFGTLCFASCAQKEEKRDQYKETHSVEEKRNAGVDSAAMDNISQKEDSLKTK
ncbi:MAG: hypothetical protein L6264_04735 [Weeksellaceae bacterium]|uniref:hypothetical protein n=1 Tax=Kaistella soli TaxID=2849654 RepID=UPI000B4B318F|nr:hypothetical protein [Kaistella soli]MBU4539143.1 hypothetical protein [Bacteroidota bacterium]MBU8882164.1 hypothetical protein [Kaistella soli]MCG2780234.1 hypothetical protein [Weeksellaceae bacterium]OWK73011.1 hypothetical protein CBW16_12260 [Flavobacteriaceae bacterium JJC]